MNVLLFCTLLTIFVLEILCEPKAHYLKAKKKKIWTQKELRWTFRDPHRLFKKDVEFMSVRFVLQKAFKVWERALDGHIVFREVMREELPYSWNDVDNSTGEYKYDKPPGIDIDILFAKREHGDREPFDGPGGTVAHSGYPPEGVLHFDGSENYSTQGGNGVDLRFVALHEIGHVLGLRHLSNEESIMNTYYRKLKKDMRLSPIDLKAIQKIYRLKKYKIFRKNV